MKHLPADPAAFPATRWSVIYRLGAAETRVAANAMESLYANYQYPLYAYLRRLGHSHEDAEDWRQSFFAYVVESGLATKASPERGRFRSFFLTCLNNFLSHERRRHQAQKRGGGQELVALDAATTEERYAMEPADRHTPESLYELSWARMVLAQTEVALENEYRAAGKHAVFKHLHPYLFERGDGEGYTSVATAIGATPVAVKTAVVRLRQRFQHALRQQVARTVNDPTLVEEELRHLQEVLTGARA